VTATLDLVAVSSEPLDVAGHEKAATHPSGGASVTFAGVVRNDDAGRRVVELEYQAYPSAERVLRGIAEEFAAEPGVLALAVSHRVGTLTVGDAALVAAVTTAHRGEAFDTCTRLVERVKHELPVWKRQVFADGSDEWVNCP
jgi:molybdopterin synthase catalytic subunit